MQVEEFNDSRWMENLPPKLKLFPINQLHIPGSHNAGAYRIELDQVSLDSCLMRSAQIFAHCFPTCFNWISDCSVFQNGSVAEQLDLGVRYFDIRYSLNKYNIYVSSHEMASESLCTIFSSIVEFLNENKEEVVLVSLKKDDTPANKDIEHAEKIMEIAKEKFGTLLTKNGKFDDSMCIEKMVGRNQRVILFLDGEPQSGKDYAWPFSAKKLPWRDTSNPKQKLKFLKEDIGNIQTSQERINGLQFTITPKKQEVLKNKIKKVTPQTMQEWRAPFKDYLPEFLSEHRTEIKERKISIITTDFVTSEFTKSIISLNINEL